MRVLGAAYEIDLSPENPAHQLRRLRSEEIHVVTQSTLLVGILE